MRKIPDKKAKKVVSLYNMGYSMKAIAKAESLSEHTVLNILHRENCPTRGRITLETKTQLVEAYKKNPCLRHVAQSIGIDITSARNILNDASFKTNRKLDSDKIDNIIKKYKAGESDCSIAQSLGVSESCVKGYIREHNKKTETTNMSQHKDEEKPSINFPKWINVGEELYKEGKPYCKIAKLVGASRKTVSYYLRQKGYKSNPKYVRHIDPMKLRKYDYSFENIFEVIDTADKAYWLGLLYADGDISSIKNTVELALKESDYAHLVKFKDFLGADNKITKKAKIVGDKKYVGYRLAFNSAKMKKDLMNLGCGPKKTFEITFPTIDQVPVCLQSDFVRGYFDGDGCISKGSTSKIILGILGTESFLTGFMNWTGLHHNSIIRFKHSDINSVAYSGRYAKYILEKMYKNSHFYLDRKYNRYLQTLNIVYNDMQWGKRRFNRLIKSE